MPISPLADSRRAARASFAAALLAFCGACGSSPAPEPSPPSPEPAPASLSAAAPDTPLPPAAEPTPAAAETPTAAPTASASAAPAKPPGRSYVACGCGCCGGIEPGQSVCVDRSKGETLDAIIARDKAARQRPSCRMAGCSIGTEYKECD